MRCDISRGDIVVTNNRLTCENGPPTFSRPLTVSINGSSSRYTIAISNSQVRLEFSNTEIHHTWPLICNQSDVTIITKAGHTYLSAEGQSPGISCINSNVSFFTTDPSASLEATNAALVGIGAAPNATCDRLLFLNGTWSADATEDGAGIGAASGDKGTSVLKSLIVNDGWFYSQGGSGIGAGASTDRGDSIVNSVVIKGGSFVLTAGHGAALGSGRAEIGRSEVKSLMIYNGTFRCTTFWGSGIGSAFAVEGVSTIGRLVIKSASIVTRGFGGIGTSPENWPTTNSFVGEVDIANGSVSLTCAFDREYDDHPCIAGDSIEINNVKIRGSTGLVFLGKGSAAHYIQPLDIAVAYHELSSSEGLQTPSLHFGWIVPLENSMEYLIHIENRILTYSIFDGPGLLLSVSRPGRYQLNFTIPHIALNGSLCYGPNETTVFVVGTTETFIEEVRFCIFGYVRRSRTVSFARTRSRERTPIASPAATADRMDNASLVAISIGAAAFLFAVFGVVVLARCKNQCDRKSEQGISIVPADMPYPGNFGEPFAETDESAA
jgi:hypothetical protein